MKLNHINLPLQDVAAGTLFFETHFGFKSENGVANDMLSVLRGNDDFVLVLMSNKFNQDGNHTYPRAFHIGFFQENNKDVIAIYERLKDAGIYLAEEPKRIRKTFGFYFNYQDILIEISADIKG